MNGSSLARQQKLLHDGLELTTSALWDASFNGDQGLFLFQGIGAKSIDENIFGILQMWTMINLEANIVTIKDYKHGIAQDVNREQEKPARKTFQQLELTLLCRNFFTLNRFSPSMYVFLIEWKAATSFVR